MLKPEPGNVFVALKFLLIAERRFDIIQMPDHGGAGGVRVACLQRVVDGAVLIQQQRAVGALFEDHRAVVKHALAQQIKH